MKILLADDSVTAQNMGKKILVEAGHEVVCVSNGAAALKKVAEQGPDLVILDIYMPGYSGLEVCQRLREARNTADLPVVLTVGKLEPFRKEDAQRVRAEALIVKPFEASELAAAVARFTEIVAAKPAKKNKAKDKDKEKEKEKSQEADPKREWEEYSDEDFVTTSQKLIEKEEEESLLRGGDSLVAASEPATGEPAESNTEHDSANEFEVSAGPAVLESTTEAPSASAAQVGFAVEEIAPEGAGSPVPQPVACTEFSVEPENTVVSPNVEVETPAPAEKATAAAAGADFGSSVPEFVSAATSVPRFVARPSAEIPCAEPTAITPETVAEPAGLPAASNFSTAAVPEFAAVPPTKPAIAPGIDPAFDPDRTQWANEFPTRFGIREPQATEPGAAPASEEAKPQASAEPAEASKAETVNAPATPTDEIAAILSSLPGGFPASMDDGSAQTSGSLSGWSAEEVPVEDRDNSVSLADEMEQAWRAHSQPQANDNSLPPQSDALQSEDPAGEPAAGQAVNSPSAGSTQEASSSATGVSVSEQESSPVSTAVQESASTGLPEAQVPGEGQATEGPTPTAAPTETKPAVSEPDRVAGVMQSAAMAIATRATISAVTSQLHAQPENGNNAAGPSSIEELVSKVLERLKPKLIAEIRRELGTPEGK